MMKYLVCGVVCSAVLTVGGKLGVTMHRWHCCRLPGCLPSVGNSQGRKGKILQLADRFQRLRYVAVSDASRVLQDEGRGEVWIYHVTPGLGVDRVELSAASRYTYIYRTS